MKIGKYQYQLDEEEKQLLKEVNAGEWVSVKNFKRVKKEAEEAAKHTLKRIQSSSIIQKFANK